VGGASALGLELAVQVHGQGPECTPVWARLGAMVLPVAGPDYHIVVAPGVEVSVDMIQGEEVCVVDRATCLGSWKELAVMVVGGGVMAASS
jgi:hypothetical protein